MQYAENLLIVCKFGGFHTLMSFLESISTLVKGSGLEDLFAEVHAENSVIHIVSGKAIARAHFLAQSVLMSLLLQETKEKNDEIGFDGLREFYERAYRRKLDKDTLNELVSCNSI